MVLLEVLIGIVIGVNSVGLIDRWFDKHGEAQERIERIKKTQAKCDENLKLLRKQLDN